jgi:hypothetical protein
VFFEVRFNSSLEFRKVTDRNNSSVQHRNRFRNWLSIVHGDNITTGKKRIDNNSVIRCLLGRASTDARDK